MGQGLEGFELHSVLAQSKHQGREAAETTDIYFPQSGGWTSEVRVLVCSVPGEASSAAAISPYLCPAE